jgi:enoyl-CoA hydratase/carnithine racemase
VQIAESARSDVFAALAAERWSGEAAADRRRLSELLAGFAVVSEAGPLQRHAATIAQACDGDDLDAIVQAIAAIASDDAWLKTAQTTLATGAPGSARLGLELQRRAAGLSLAEVFRLEYVVALHCAAHGDFAEGIRALLIDKDRQPRWNPATLGAASREWSDAFFRAPAWPGGAHPLADLGRTAGASA